MEKDTRLKELENKVMLKSNSLFY